MGVDRTGPWWYAVQLGVVAVVVALNLALVVLLVVG